MSSSSLVSPSAMACAAYESKRTNSLGHLIQNVFLYFKAGNVHLQLPNSYLGKRNECLTWFNI